MDFKKELNNLSWQMRDNGDKEAEIKLTIGEIEGISSLLDAVDNAIDNEHMLWLGKELLGVYTDAFVWKDVKYARQKLGGGE